LSNLLLKILDSPIMVYFMIVGRGDQMKKIIKDFMPMGGRHCITNALKQIFHYYGCHLSEEMIFGLGEGLDFTYINLSSSPMVSGRTKIMEFEDVLAQRLGIELKFRKGKDYDEIFRTTKSMIDADQPVFVYADMPYLPYLSLGESGHFGGHAVVIFGYDDEQENFYVSDRDNSDYSINTPGGEIGEDYHCVGYECMKNARSSSFRPFPANNKYIAKAEFGGYQGVKPDMLLQAVWGVCGKMLSPSAKLKGVCGIEKFSKEIVKWSSFDIEKRKLAGVTNYFQISKDGGTGGGIFRKMYGDFLQEAAGILDNNMFEKCAAGYKDLSGRWECLADDMWSLSADGDAGRLSKMSLEIKKLQEIEFDLLTNLKIECEALLG